MAAKKPLVCRDSWLLDVLGPAVARDLTVRDTFFSEEGMVCGVEIEYWPIDPKATITSGRVTLTAEGKIPVICTKDIQDALVPLVERIDVIDTLLCEDDQWLIFVIDAAGSTLTCYPAQLHNQHPINSSWQILSSH